MGRLRACMQAQGVDGAVLLGGPNVCYATGHVPVAVDASHANHRRAVAIVSAADGPVRLHAHDPVGEAMPAGVESGDPLWPELDDGAAALDSAIADVLGDVTGCKVAVDAVTGAMARAGVLDGAELVDASRVLGPARVVKTEDELDCIDRAQRQTEQAMIAAQDACVPGVTRAEVAGAFLAALRDGDTGPGLLYRNGIDPIFQPMPTRRDGGPRTSTGHVAFPTGVDNPVYAGGDLVWVDAGVGHHGYMSDFGRTWVAGRGPTAAEQSLFDRWMAVLDASLAAVRPGATLGDVGRAARAVEPDETPMAAAVLPGSRNRPRERRDAHDRHRPGSSLRRRLRAGTRHGARVRAGRMDQRGGRIPGRGDRGRDQRRLAAVGRGPSLRAVPLMSDDLIRAHRDRVLDAMVEAGIDVLVLGRQDNAGYACGMRRLWTAAPGRSGPVA